MGPQRFVACWRVEKVFDRHRIARWVFTIDLVALGIAECLSTHRVAQLASRHLSRKFLAQFCSWTLLWWVSVALTAWSWTGHHRYSAPRHCLQHGCAAWYCGHETYYPNKHAACNARVWCMSAYLFIAHTLRDSLCKNPVPMCQSQCVSTTRLVC